ncbi:MAG: hypothetical protein IT324_20805 [Anaerolineae bacterium]|nr:hypothetical protein [Anaerolineae bacterium]
MQITHTPAVRLLTRTHTIPGHVHCRAVWIGVLAEAAFIGLGAAGAWRNFSPPLTNVTPTDNNVTLTIANLVNQFPAILVLTLALILLVLLPGWIVSLWLEDQPSLVGSVLFGFAALGGVLLFSQWAQIPTIWPALILHLAWQVVIEFVSRKKAADVNLLPYWQMLTVALNVILMGLFMMYLNPVIRVDTFDNWSILRTLMRISVQIGVRTGDARADWTAWIAVNAWLTNLTGISILALINNLWHIVLPPLVVLVMFSGVNRLSGNNVLATLAAWMTLLAIVTSVGFGPLYAGQSTLPYTLSRTEMVTSDKWVALVLLVPAGMFVFANAIRRKTTWRTVLAILIALLTSMIYHPQGLTSTAWIAVVYLVVELATGQVSRLRLVFLAVCLAILFVFIPAVFARSYILRDIYTGNTTGPEGIHSGWYVALTPTTFIPNPGVLNAPLLIGALVLTLVAGIRHRDPLRRLLSGWTWAIFLLYIPPFATLFDRLWFPTWMDRFTWSIPFGALAAVGLWHVLRQRKGIVIACVALLTAGLIPVSHIEPDKVDWRLNQQPVLDQSMRDLVDYFRREQITGTVLSEVPGVQTPLYHMLWLQVPLPGISLPGYGFPDIQRLYATPYWGAKALKDYMVGIVNWLIVERQSPVMAQIGLQPNRYQLTYENAAYLLYRVSPDLRITPVDELVHKLADPKTLTAQSIPAIPTDDPYAQVVVGMAYTAVGNCDQAVSLFEKALAQSTFAREPYLKGLAACGRKDQVRASAAAWRDDPALAPALLSDDVIRLIDPPTLETALQHWLARPNYQRDERKAARQVAQSIAQFTGRLDLAAVALHRLPDVLLESQDWLSLAHWSVLSGKPDLALYHRAGRDDVARLMEGELSSDPAQAKAAYQAAAAQTNDPLALLFLAQTCESLNDMVCAQATYQRAAALSDPLAFYAVQALIRLGENVVQNQSLARAMAQAYTLSYYEQYPAPTIKPLTAGQVLYDVQVSARWRDPLTDPLPKSRYLDVTFTNPLPQGRAIYTNLGMEGQPPLPLSVYVPPNASATWTVALPIPDLNKTETPPLRVSIAKDKGSALLADMIAWLPPRAAANTDTLATFGEGLQLRSATAVCDKSNETALTLTWLPTKPITGRYSLFIHAYDAAGKLVSQIDQRPFNDAYPTDLWVVNYPFQSTHTIPNGTGAAQLRLGWYLLTDGSRLPLQGNESANGVYTLPVTLCKNEPQ